MEDRYITLAIHTYDRAIALKNLLHREGVEAVLHNVNLSSPVVSSGVRVRIHENDLPLALRIVENYEIFVDFTPTDNEKSNIILVPVDFSDYSLRATLMAFDIANHHKASIRLLHSYMNPALSKPTPFKEVFAYESAESKELGRKLQEEATKKMELFENSIKRSIKQGEIPPLKFSSIITEGVPEDVINEMAKTLNPMLIVMGTRGAGRKEEELIGSVTAELLDTCRFPVFAIPESVKLEKVEQIANIMFFYNLEQEDFLALDTIARLFCDMPLNVTLVNVPSKKLRSELDSSSTAPLIKYCREHYPKFEIEVQNLRPGSAIDDYRKIEAKHPINLIALPNKKRNVFSRFFNPSLAHRLLLHTDVPMIVIPV